MKFIEAKKLADTMSKRDNYSYPAIIPAFSDTQSPSFIPGFYRIDDKMVYCEGYNVSQELLDDGIGVIRITPEAYSGGVTNILGRSWWVCELNLRVRNDRTNGGELVFTTTSRYVPVDGGDYTLDEWVAGQVSAPTEPDVVENEDTETSVVEEEIDDATASLSDLLKKYGKLKSANSED